MSEGPSDGWTDAVADTWTARGAGAAGDPDQAAGGLPVDSALVARLRAEVTDRLDARLQADEAAGLPRLSPADQRQFGRQLISEALEAEARAAVAAGRPALDLAAEDAVAQAVADALFGLGRLQRLLDDPQIENINAQGCDQVFVRYADGTELGWTRSPTPTKSWSTCFAWPPPAWAWGSGALTLAPRGCRCSFLTAAGCSR